MKRMYIVLVNGIVAKTRMTLTFAMKDKRELEAKGCNNVSVAYKLVS